MWSTADKLKKSDLFRGKTIEEVQLLLSTIQYRLVEFRRNQLIFSVEDKTNEIGLIIKGSIEVQKNMASGKRVSILYKGAGDMFGEGSVFSKTTTYPADIFAKEKSTILFIDKENMLYLLHRDMTLFENFMASFANRVLHLNLKTELLSYSGIQQKVAFSLLNLMDDFKKENVVHLPYAKKTWAEHLNVSRPSLLENSRPCAKKTF